MAQNDTFKKLFLVASLVVIVFLGMGALGPKSTKVERSITIEKPPTEVYDYLSNLNNVPTWHFWKKYDANINYSVPGQTSGEGAQLNWSGNEQVGKGHLKIRKADAPRYLELDLDYTEPWEAHATNFFSISPTENGSEVVWGYEAKNKFISRMSMLFMNMDELLGPDYEHALEALKNKIENQPSEE